jgi:hypothetical protein
VASSHDFFGGDVTHPHAVADKQNNVLWLIVVGSTAQHQKGE